jgi:rare lipoprotein A
LDGLASYYAEPYHGRKTANGEVFDTYQELTAAHRTLPFNTFVRVTNKANGRAVEVRINDRGPFIDGRVIDLSLRAAREIDMVRAGVTPVVLLVLKTLPATATSASFAVQVGAFEDRDAAEDLKRELEKKYSGVVIQSVSAERTFYRVRIRQPDERSANRVASQLRSEDFEPFVVRLN